MHGVHSYCFCEGKLVIVYAENKGYWTPPGGGIEEGESVEEAAVREILEETNMRVIAQRPVGLFRIFENDKITHQARTVCVVEHIGPFQPSSDEEITEIKLIDPADLTQYFDWGKEGAHQLKRSLELYAEIRESR